MTLFFGARYGSQERGEVGGTFLRRGMTALAAFDFFFPYGLRITGGRSAPRHLDRPVVRR